jgi:lipopolysaccharide export system permease protein
MKGVTIIQADPGGAITTILAERGSLSYTPDGKTAVLRLRDGQIHEIPAEEGGPSKYHRMVFKTHVIHIAGAGGVLERTVREARTDREMSARALDRERQRLVEQYDTAVEYQKERIRELAAVPDSSGPWREQAAEPGATHARNIAKAIGGPVVRLWQRFVGSYDPLVEMLDKIPQERSEFELLKLERQSLRKRIASLSVEIHKKFSLPAACVVFVLLGAPLGMRVRRAGPSVAFISVAFFLFYYLCLVGGEELANRLFLPPWFSMWLPNIVLGAWGLQWTLRACEITRSRPARAVPLRAAA